MKEQFNKYLIENSKLTNIEREVVLNSFQPMSLDKKSYLVKSGILRVFNEVDGEQTTLDFTFDNSFSTFLTSLVFQQPSIFSIQALVNSDLLVISRENHFSLMNKYKNWLEIDNIQFFNYSFSNIICCFIWIGFSR